MKSKVLWFSRHEMTKEQKAALGDSDILQVSKSVQHANELKDEIDKCDIIAVVAPTDLQKEFLDLAGNKPVITAVNDRVLVKQQNGEDKVQFNFVKWEQVKHIEIEKVDFDIDIYKLEHYFKDQSLKNIKIPADLPEPTEKAFSMEYLGDNAFPPDCTDLKSIKIPNSLFSEPTEEELEEFESDPQEPAEEYEMVDGTHADDIEEQTPDIEPSDQLEDMDHNYDEEDLGDMD